MDTFELRPFKAIWGDLVHLSEMSCNSKMACYTRSGVKPWMLLTHTASDLVVFHVVYGYSVYLSQNAV